MTSAVGSNLILADHFPVKGIEPHRRIYSNAKVLRELSSVCKKNHGVSGL